MSSLWILLLAIVASTGLVIQLLSSSASLQEEQPSDDKISECIVIVVSLVPRPSASSAICRVTVDLQVTL